MAETQTAWQQITKRLEKARPESIQETTQRPMKVVVYTAIFGDIDPLWPVFPAAVDASYVCFSDIPRREQGLWTHRLTEDWPTLAEGSTKFSALHDIWDVRVVEPEFKSLRKTARWYKALPHIHFPNADVSIWVDGNVRLLLPAKAAIKKWLGNDSLAIFDHHDRRCLYKEAEFCVSKGKGNKSKLAAQTKAYRQAGMPSWWGLPETKCVIRRNTAKIQEMNLAWWEQLNTYSERDQVSLPFVCWRLNMRWRPIPGRAGLISYPGDKNRAFWYTKHKKGQSNA